MAFVAINDKSGRAEVTVFADVYNSCRELLVKDQIIVIDGELSADEYTGGFRISSQKIMSIDQARELYAKRLLIHLNHREMVADKADCLKSILKEHLDGKCPVFIDYVSDKAKVVLPLGAKWRVKLNENLLESLNKSFSDGCVEVCY